MRPIIIHMADTHLRERQYNSPTRGDDFFAAAMEVVETAHRMGASFIANCGDMLNSRHPSSGTIAQLHKLNAKLIEYNIVMGVISGNHDKADPPWHSLLPRRDFHEGGIIDMDNREYGLNAEGRLFKVLGLPFCTKAELLTRLRGLKEPVDIVMWHGAVKEFCGFATDDVVTMADLEACDMVGTFLLGDIHVHQYMGFDKRPGFVGYPGSTELCEKGEALDKCVGAIYWDGTAKCLTVQEVPIPTRKVLCRQVGASDMLETLLAELAGLKAERIILLGNYNPQLPQVLMRVRLALHPDSIMLMTPQTYVTSDGVASAVQPSAIVKPSDLVPSILRTDNAALLATASSLADSPDADADAVIQDYLKTHYGL